MARLEIPLRASTSQTVKLQKQNQFLIIQNCVSSFYIPSGKTKAEYNGVNSAIYSNNYLEIW